MRIATLNLNHRTHAKCIPEGLCEALGGLNADVLVLTEYVDGDGRMDFKRALSHRGFENILISEAIPYTRGRWQNQIMIASRMSMEALDRPKMSPDHQDDSALSNFLSVEINGLRITGLRAPTYKRVAEWYAYCEWLASVLDADVLIGDLNARGGTFTGGVKTRWHSATGNDRTLRAS